MKRGNALTYRRPNVKIGCADWILKLAPSVLRTPLNVGVSTQFRSQSADCASRNFTSVSSVNSAIYSHTQRFNETR